MDIGMGSISPNYVNNVIVMSWQEWIIAAIAVVVAIIVARRIWHLFTCGTTQCSSCDKECPHRKG